VGIFDEQIEKTAGYVQEMRSLGRQVRELSAPDESPGSPLPRVGPGAGTGLVPKSETFLELGSPTAGSCAFALHTDRPALVADGRVWLIGPDIQETSGGTLPFGQVIIAGGDALSESAHRDLVEIQHVGDQIEGFMVKSTPGRLWSRVSAAAAGKGFSFGFLGAALIRLTKEQIPAATAVEVLFVTSGKADLESLGAIAASVGEVARGIRERQWLERGIDISECAFGGHCGSCSDKAVCDGVRKMARSRKILAQGT
jgi:CO dehydrogenase/acetyl-CoA synthase beta subunit